MIEAFKRRASLVNIWIHKYMMLKMFHCWSCHQQSFSETPLPPINLYILTLSAAYFITSPRTALYKHIRKQLSPSASSKMSFSLYHDCTLASQMQTNTLKMNKKLTGEQLPSTQCELGTTK